MSHAETADAASGNSIEERFNLPLKPGTIAAQLRHATKLFSKPGEDSGPPPAERPTWSQAMKGEASMTEFLRVDKRPFTVLFLLVLGSFIWLFFIYNVRNGETEQSATTHHAAPPAAGHAATPHTTQAFTAPTLTAPGQPATVDGGSHLFGQPNTSAYYGQAPWIPHGQPAQQGYLPATSAFGAPQQGMRIYTPHAQPQYLYGQGASPMSGNGLGYGVYAPLTNGRSRLVVNR
jgi:hypothetical protein